MLIFENNGSEDAEYSEDAEDDKKSVNFNSQLTMIKSVQFSRGTSGKGARGG